MTQEKSKKQPRDAGIFLGGAVVGLGGLVCLAGISGLFSVLAGAASLAAAVTGAGYVAAIVASFVCLAKGTIMMGKGFTQAGKTNAEALLEQDPQNAAFTLQPLTRDFDLEARRGVKVMRPLKLSPKNTLQH